jgi:hypothetical protein
MGNDVSLNYSNDDAMHSMTSSFLSVHSLNHMCNRRIMAKNILKILEGFVKCML